MKINFKLFTALMITGAMLGLPAVAEEVGKDKDKTIAEIVEKEDIDAFSDLYILGYDVDQKDSKGKTPLMLAAETGKVKFLTFLLDNEADVEKCTNEGRNALHFAARKGHTEIITILINAGILPNMPDANGMTPLMLAAEAGKKEAVLLLLESGADVGFRNKDGHTAYDIAKSARKKEVSDLLSAAQTRTVY